MWLWAGRRSPYGLLRRAERERRSVAGYEAQRQFGCGRRDVGPGAGDLDTDARRVGEDVELLDAHDGDLDSRIGQAQGGDLMGQGLDQLDMALRGQLAHAIYDPLVAHDGGVIVESG